MAQVWEWDVGETRVRATVAAFRGLRIKVGEGGEERVRSGHSIKTRPLDIPGGLAAELRHGGSLFTSTGFRLDMYVNGLLTLPRSAPKGFPTQVTHCPHCAAMVQADHRFCDACGKALPTPEELLLQRDVAQANSAVGAVSALFVLAGGLMYLAQRVEAEKALANIASYAADAPLAEPIPGVANTIGELRTQIEFETWSVLGGNILLAAVMFGLWRWGKVRPSAAITVAFCTYIVVLVVNAALDPKTIAQGWIVKLLVIFALVRGLKAALALRSLRKA